MFLKSLATAVGLMSVFAVASAATLPPARCETIVDQQAEQTKCTYLQPKAAVMGPKSGWQALSKVVDGTETSACTAYFKDMQKKLGPCNMLPRWEK